MNIPANLLYAATHEWVQFLDNGRARIGISDHAQEAMGDVVFINICDEGEVVTAGDVFGDVESVKAVSDLLSPVDGTVAGVNEEVLSAPELLNADPYHSWLIELEDAKENPALMDASAYADYLTQEQLQG